VGKARSLCLSGTPEKCFAGVGIKLGRKGLLESEITNIKSVLKHWFKVCILKKKYFYCSLMKGPIKPVFASGDPGQMFVGKAHRKIFEYAGKVCQGQTLQLI
jgi:hypothetical protein